MTTTTAWDLFSVLCVPHFNHAKANSKSSPPLLPTATKHEKRVNQKGGKRGGRIEWKGVNAVTTEIERAIDVREIYSTPEIVTQGRWIYIVTCYMGRWGSQRSPPSCHPLSCSCALHGSHALHGYLTSCLSWILLLHKIISQVGHMLVLCPSILHVPMRAPCLRVKMSIPVFSITLARTLTPLNSPRKKKRRLIENRHYIPWHYMKITCHSRTNIFPSRSLVSFFPSFFSSSLSSSLYLSPCWFPTDCPFHKRSLRSKDKSKASSRTRSRGRHLAAVIPAFLSPFSSSFFPLCFVRSLVPFRGSLLVLFFVAFNCSVSYCSVSNIPINKLRGPNTAALLLSILRLLLLPLHLLNHFIVSIPP